MGYIYKRKYTDKKHKKTYEGKIYWIQYCKNGKVFRESSKSTKKTFAQNLLKEKEGEIAKGETPSIIYTKVTLKDLKPLLIADYNNRERDTVEKAEYYSNRLIDFFGDKTIPEITSDAINDLIEARKKEGLSNATINRELSALHKMLTLGTRCTPRKVSTIPYIPKLKEDNVRKGFFEYEEYAMILLHAEENFKPFIAFAYHTGMREAEIFSLKWDAVDIEQESITLYDTKNEETRTIYFNDNPELKTIILGQEERRPNEKFEWVFFDEKGRPFNHDSVRKEWTRACIEAGFFKEVTYRNKKTVKVATKLFHDLRRSAVRNMIRNGIQEEVAMKISGHKTRSVFNRYNIIDANDLKEASKKMGEAQSKSKQSENAEINLTPLLALMLALSAKVRI